MSKKFYELVAGLIRDHNDGKIIRTADLIDDFVTEFAKENPLFDEKRFRKACAN